MAINREYGTEQPYIPLGIFKLRLPFIHYKWEWPEAIQGAILVAVALGSIPIHQELLGVPFEVALVMVALNGLLYLLHPTFGDPVFPGWITPAIPLVLAWGKGYAAGPDRIHAIIALQLSMAILFLFLGIFILSYIVSFARFGKIPGLHLYSAVSAGYAQSIFFFVLFVWGFYPWMLYVVATWGIIAYTEKIFILFKLDDIKIGVKGLYWVMKKEKEKAS